MSLFMKDLIVYAVIIIFVLVFTKQNNLWGTKKGVTKAKVDVQKDKNIAKKRNFILWLLQKGENTCKGYGFKPSDAKVDNYKFMISRSRLEVPYVDRNISPYELLGLFKIIKFIVCFLTIILILITGARFFFILFLILGINKIFEFVIEFKIMDEDKEIERDFPDLFLLLYSRLIRGTQSRLSPTLDEYLNSLDVNGEQSNMAIRSFVMDLRKNIEIYGDDSMALHKLRDTYKSAMVINFLNLAIQSLRGVDNKDKLMAFKMELSQKKLETMTEKANKMVEKGQKAIYLIFIILAEFIVLSWLAKAGVSFAQFL